MTQPSSHLKKIVAQVKRSTESKEDSLVVFDLDSTLFDVSPRIQRILHDFSHDKINIKNFPESCKIIQKIETQPHDWGIKDAIIRAGLEAHHPDFHSAIKEFWKKSFFSNEYLIYDQPYDGAAEYVQKLYDAGATIVYLTGRDIARMGSGSLQGLLQWKFPVNRPRTELVLKPDKELNDAQFKSDFFFQQLNKTYSQIWFFENEPVNIDLVRKEHPKVEVVFFKSTHSGLSIPPKDLPTIMHYLLD